MQPSKMVGQMNKINMTEHWLETLVKSTKHLYVVVYAFVQLVVWLLPFQAVDKCLFHCNCSREQRSGMEEKRQRIRVWPWNPSLWVAHSSKKSKECLAYTRKRHASLLFRMTITFCWFFFSFSCSLKLTHSAHDDLDDFTFSFLYCVHVWSIWSGMMGAHKSVGPLVVYVIEGKCLLSMSRNFLSRDPSVDDCAWLPVAEKSDVQLM